MGSPGAAARLGCADAGYNIRVLTKAMPWYVAGRVTLITSACVQRPHQLRLMKHHVGTVRPGQGVSSDSENEIVTPVRLDIFFVLSRQRLTLKACAIWKFGILADSKAPQQRRGCRFWRPDESKPVPVGDMLMTC